MERFFIPYSRNCDFWEDAGDFRHPSREFWDWAEIILGERAALGDDPTVEKQWDIFPHNDWVVDKDHIEGGYYANGRQLIFYDSNLAMMFKLRWI